MRVIFQTWEEDQRQEESVSEQTDWNPLTLNCCAAEGRRAVRLSVCGGKTSLDFSHSVTTCVDKKNDHSLFVNVLVLLHFSENIFVSHLV